MKTTLLKLFRSTVLLSCSLTSFPPVSFAQSPALPPTADFQAELVNGTGKWSLVFDTLPGYGYTVEESQDLVSWTPAGNGMFYGNGSQQKCYICDGPMPPAPSSGNGGITPPTTPTWTLQDLQFVLQLQSNNGSPYYRLKRPAYTPNGGTSELAVWDEIITGSLPAQDEGSRTFPLLEWNDTTTHTMYWVTVTTQTSSDPIDPDTYETTPEQAADTQVFQAIKAQLIARLAAPDVVVGPHVPTPHKFARLKRTELDVNQNLLWDWWELGNGFAPFSLAGQVGYGDPNGDDDHDGLTNQQEQAGGTFAQDPDTDKDGFLDGEDSNAKDPTIHPPATTYLIMAHRKVDLTQNSPAYTQYKTTNWGDIFPSQDFSQSPYTSIGALVAELATISYPENQSDKALKGLMGDSVVDAYVTRSTYGATAQVTGWVDQARCWLVHKPIESVDTTAEFFTTTARTLMFATTYGDPVKVTLTVPAGKTLSEHFDLEPATTPEPIPTDFWLVASKEISPGLTIFSGQNATAPVTDDKKVTVGAFTVANLNDTDGDDIVDKYDNEVKVASNNVPSATGKLDEVDLMKLVISGPSRGKMRLKVVNGSIKLWEKSTKETAITLTDGTLVVEAANLPKTVWIEATAISATVRDIELKVGHEDPTGKFTDDLAKVKATAVWVAPTANGVHITGNQLPDDADNQPIINTFNNQLGAAFGARLSGQGASQTADYSIGFEFLVSPAGVGSESDVVFDISRKRESASWLMNPNLVWTANPPVPLPSGDLVNDDSTNEDEDSDPLHNHIYSVDNPATLIGKFTSLPVNRVVKRANFKEFVRIKFDGVPFKNRNADVEGSRCSVNRLWNIRSDLSRDANNSWIFTPGENTVGLGNDPLGAHP